MMNKYEGKAMEILELCMRAKEEGHDVFFNYSPHVNEFSVDFHVGGWVVDTSPTSRHTSSTIEESSRCTWSTWPCSQDEIIQMLKTLIETGELVEVII